MLKMLQMLKFQEKPDHQKKKQKTFVIRTYFKKALNKGNVKDVEVTKSRTLTFPGKC